MRTTNSRVKTAGDRTRWSAILQGSGALKKSELLSVQVFSSRVIIASAGTVPKQALKSMRKKVVGGVWDTGTFVIYML